MLTLQFIPYNEINGLSSNNKIKKILGLVREDKIVLMEGRLKHYEETNLIQKTMEIVNKKFKGVELCTIYPELKNDKLFQRIRQGVVNFLVGDRQGLTVVGPATIIKEIKRDPNKILLLTENLPRKRRRSRK